VEKILESKLVELIESFQSAATASGKAVAAALPQITEYAIRIKFWESLGYLVLAPVLFILAALVFRFLVRPCYNGYREAEDYTQDSWLMGVAFSSIAVFGLVIAGIGLLCNPWNWCGVLEPKVALAHDIYVMVMEKLAR